MRNKIVEVAGVKDGPTRRSLEALERRGVYDRVGMLFYPPEPDAGAIAIPSGATPRWLDFGSIISPKGWFHEIDFGGTPVTVWRAPYEGMWRIQLEVDLSTDGADRLWRARLQSPWNSNHVFGGGTEASSRIRDHASGTFWFRENDEVIPGINVINGGVDATLNYFRASYEFIGRPTEMLDDPGFPF